MTYENDCYVEYMDGTTDWTIPKDWHATVSDVEGNSEFAVDEKRLQNISSFLHSAKTSQNVELVFHRHSASTTRLQIGYRVQQQ